MPDLPRQIRLAPGDYFMYGQDSRMRQVGLAGNVCCAVIKLGKGFDIERLRRRISESPFLDWLARTRISRPLPVLLPPLWRASDNSQCVVFEHNINTSIADKPLELPAVVAGRRLEAKSEPGLVFDVVRHDDGTSHLFLSWNHTHLDARGLDLLLNYLNGAEPTGKPPYFISPTQLGWNVGGWWGNVVLARKSLKWLNESGQEPLFTLLPPGPQPRHCQNHYRILDFSTEETARIDARCQQFNCGFRRSHFYLAASVRALHGVAAGRGNRDGAYLVPVPHDTRKRGANGPIFSNHLSILFYRIEPKFAGRMGDILGELGRQMTNQIRDRFPESCMAALNMFKPLPVGYYLHHLGKPTRGKMATFSFSDSGDTCAGIKDLWGAPIQEVTHLVPSWRPPGLTIVFLRFNQRLSTLISFVDDCLTPMEADRMENDIRQALFEESP